MERYLLRDDIWWVGRHRLGCPRLPRVRDPPGHHLQRLSDPGREGGFGRRLPGRLRPRGAGPCAGLLRTPSGGLPGDQPRGARSFRGHPLAGRTARSRADLLLETGQGCARSLLRSRRPWTVGTCRWWVPGTRSALGRNTLQFIEAPMLHWPDSMFTYVKEAKTLLPNDAFGQHLATSKRFADEVDMSVVMEEASKYYANILMPFGGQIQKMLAKIGETGPRDRSDRTQSRGHLAPARGRGPHRARPTQGWSDFQAPERVSLDLRHHVALHREDDHGHRGRGGSRGRGLHGGQV